MATASPIMFDAVIEIRGINPYVLVSTEQAQDIKPGWRRAMPVLVQLNGKPAPPWRINMMPVGDGSFYLYLGGRLREQVTAGLGDMVTVSLSFDHEYRSGPQHDMDPAFAAGLKSNPEINARWEGLTPSLRKEVLRYLATLKSDAARTRNVERVLRVLGGAKERFMARDWN